VVLGRTIPGTLVFTSSLLTFTVDDSTEEYSKAANLVRSDLIPWPLLLHIYTYTSDVMLNCNYKKVINYMLWKLKIILIIWLFKECKVFCGDASKVYCKYQLPLIDIQ